MPIIVVNVAGNLNSKIGSVCTQSAIAATF